VLVHELAHIRDGQGRLLGFGSPLHAAVRLWPVLLLLFGLLPILLQITGGIAETIARHHHRQQEFSQLISGLQAGGEPAPQIKETLAKLAPPPLTTEICRRLRIAMGVYGLGLPLMLAGATLWVLTMFMLPIAAIWCAEFSADRVAAKSLPGRAEAALGLHEEGGRLRRLLNRLSHPPIWLRRWVMRHESRIYVLPLLLLFLPAVDALRVVPLLWRGLLGTAGAHLDALPGAASLMADAQSWTVMFFTWQMPLRFAVMGAVICLWPVWLTLHAGTRSAASEEAPLEWGAYLCAGGLLFLLAAAGWLARPA
jgi:hypothetical protein